jgi:hypothetical protein
MDMPREDVNQHLPADPVLQTGSDPLCTKDYPKRLAPLEVAVDGGKISTVALRRQQFIPHLHKNEIIHDHWLVFVAFEELDISYAMGQQFDNGSIVPVGSFVGRDCKTI